MILDVEASVAGLNIILKHEGYCMTGTFSRSNAAVRFTGRHCARISELYKYKFRSSCCGSADHCTVCLYAVNISLSDWRRQPARLHCDDSSASNTAATRAPSFISTAHGMCTRWTLYNYTQGDFNFCWVESLIVFARWFH